MEQLDLYSMVHQWQELSAHYSGVDVEGSYAGAVAVAHTPWRNFSSGS
jgi:hypothetical protein